MSNHKKPADKHSAIFAVLFRKQELAALKKAATERGESAGAFVRRLVKGALPQAKPRRRRRKVLVVGPIPTE